VEALLWTCVLGNGRWPVRHYSPPGLGPSVVSRLLAIHVISGCDTTPCSYGHGKVSIFKKLRQAVEIQSSINVLESSVSSHQEVMEAGCGLLSLLYGRTCTDKLNVELFNHTFNDVYWSDRETSERYVLYSFGFWLSFHDDDLHSTRHTCSHQWLDVMKHRIGAPTAPRWLIVTGVVYRDTGSDYPSHLFSCLFKLGYLVVDSCM